jgi:hypothetical protein
MVRSASEFDCRLVVNETTKNGDQWKESHAVTENQNFDRISCCALNVAASVKGLCPRCAKQLHSLE